jgi:DNA-binding NarL/FixJ family response regulator
MQQLTDMELATLLDTANGLKVKDIALKHHYSTIMVKRYRQGILNKFGATTASQAVALGLVHGIIKSSQIKHMKG